MPWKECKPMDERLKFVARLLDGEKMASLCRFQAFRRPFPDWSAAQRAEETAEKANIGST